MQNLSKSSVLIGVRSLSCSDLSSSQEMLLSIMGLSGTVQVQIKAILLGLFIDPYYGWQSCVFKKDINPFFNRFKLDHTSQMHSSFFPELT